jgi:orotate phosphoribosyltransferase
MRPENVLGGFEDTGALLCGHFKLSSGLHSDRYLQCAKVLQWPSRAAELGAALAAQLRPFGPVVVVSPAMGGLIIGHEVGRGLFVRAIFAERAEGTFQLRRGFGLSEGERVAVVEDVITTGKSTREVLDLVRGLGAEPVVCGSIVDRRGEERRRREPLIADVPVRSLVALEVETWEPATCPLCEKGIPVDSPGSRFLRASSQKEEARGPA